MKRLAQVHRFGNSVAIYTGGTMYLGPDEACQLARALINAARDIDSHPFAESKCGTVTVEGVTESHEITD